MIFLYIRDSQITDSQKKEIERFKQYVKDGKDIFVLIFKVGCPPCEMTIPEWKLIEDKLTNKYKNNDNIVVADINMEMLDLIQDVVGSIDGFPTMKYIGSNGKVIEPYEESSISKKDRSVESFVSWIESKNEKKHSRTKHNRQNGGTKLKRGSKRYRNKTKRNKKKSNKRK
jgi:thiol-disulfide isomerase/thioredoxin